MSGNVKITGVPTHPAANGEVHLSFLLQRVLTVVGSVPIRRELRDLQANYPDVWNVFILGMKAYQAADEQQLTSYYQVAGKVSSPSPRMCL